MMTDLSCILLSFRNSDIFNYHVYESNDINDMLRFLGDFLKANAHIHVFHFHFRINL